MVQAVQHVTEQEKIHAYYRLVKEFVKQQTDKCEPGEGCVKRNSRGGGYFLKGIEKNLGELRLPKVNIITTPR